jgi:hypothetical protein
MVSDIEINKIFALLTSFWSREFTRATQPDNPTKDSWGKAFRYARCTYGELESATIAYAVSVEGKFPPTVAHLMEYVRKNRE